VGASAGVVSSRSRS